MHERLIILDFGSQTTQLIGRRVRELNMYCEIVPYNKFPQDAADVKGVILSGSPYSVYDKNAFKTDLSNIRGKYPILGICYGAQFLAYTSGGKVESADSREYGRANLTNVDGNDPLFKGIESGSQIWMSHGDTITQLPDNFRIIASTNDVQNAACRHISNSCEVGNITNKQLRDVYRTLVPFRNTCAHGERLYCARAGVRGDKRFADMIMAIARVSGREAAGQLIASIENVAGILSEIPGLDRLVEPYLELDRAKHALE